MPDFSGAYPSASLDAEQAVLGAILLDNSVLGDVAEQIKIDFFSISQHKDIYEAMLTIESSGGSTIDPLLIIEMLKSKKTFGSEADGKQYLFGLLDAVPSVSNVKAYCKIIKDNYYLRTLVNVSNEIIDMAKNSGEDADLLLDRAEQKIYEIRKDRSIKGTVRLSEAFKSLYQKLYDLNSEDAEQHKGLPTGFPDLDKMITGLNRSDLVIIGARPAMGKTSFTLNMARNVAVLSRKTVLVFSLEMSTEQLAQRLVSTEARIPGIKMRTGQLTPDEWLNLNSACMFLSDFNIYLDDTTSLTVREMKARARKLKNCSAIFIDYLQLMTSDKKTDNRVQEVTDITRNLKLMAKELMVPVVVCAQLSRSTEGRGQSHKPQLADLRESGSIEQDADIVLMLYRPDYYKGEKDKDEHPEQIEVNTAQVLVQKNRHGPTGVVDMVWDAKYTLYTCAAPKSDNPDIPPERGGNNNAE